MTRTAAGAERLYPTREIPLAQIVESRGNPRTVFREIEELAQSMRENGQIEPAIVRTNPNLEGPPFELVVGARRFRAAPLAGLPVLWCEVRGSISDKEALELSLVENDQRYPVHPLDEAEAYRRLHEDHASSLEEIARKAGRTVGHIRQRLQLVRLCTEGRALFTQGAVQLAGAFMIARLPLVELQVQLCEELRRMHSEDEAAIDSWRIRKLIQERYLTALAAAPWPKKLPMVLADGAALPACSTCPKRTGAQGELWEEVTADFCTDALCYAKKKARYFEQLQERLKKDGNVVLDAKTSRAYFLGGSPTMTTTAPYLDLDAPLALSSSGRTLRAILGKIDRSHIVGAVDAAGAIHELLAKEAVPELLAKAGHSQMGENAARVLGPARVTAAHAVSEEMKRNVERVATATALDAMVEQAMRREPRIEFWVVLVGALLGMLSREATKRVCERRGLRYGGRSAERTPADAIATAAAAMPEAHARGLVIELAVMQGVVKGEAQAFADARELFGIDWSKELSKARRTLKLPNEAKKPAKKLKLDELADDDDDAAGAPCCEVMLMAASKRRAGPEEVLSRCPACDALGMQIEEVIAEGPGEGYLPVVRVSTLTEHMLEGGEGVVGQHSEARVAAVLADLMRRKRVSEDTKGVLHTKRRPHEKKFEKRGAVNVRVR